MNDNERIVEDENRVNGEISVKRSKTVDLIAKIGCVLVAFVLWVYVMSTESTTYEQEFSMPVEIENNSGLSVLSSSTAYAEIRVKGKKSVLSKLSATDLRAYVSLSAAENGEAGKYSVPVQFSLPSNITLSSYSPASVNVYLDNTTTTSVPIRVRVVDYMLEEGYELGESDITTSIGSVSVSGPAAELDNISCAQITVALGHVTRTVTCSGELELIDGNGNPVKSNYIKLMNSYATVTVPVYKYRTLPLDVTYKYGYYNDSNTSITVEPSSVTIKGEADLVDSASWSYEIDEKKIISDGNYSVKISLPDGVENVSGEDSASISISHTGMADKEITISEFNVINPGDLEYAVINDSLNITIRGNSSLVNFITEQSITASIDLSAQKNVSATVLVPVTVTFAGIYDGNVYELGSYSVSVRIAGKQS